MFWPPCPPCPASWMSVGTCPRSGNSCVCRLFTSSTRCAERAAAKAKKTVRASNGLPVLLILPSLSCSKNRDTPVRGGRGKSTALEIDRRRLSARRERVARRALLLLEQPRPVDQEREGRRALIRRNTVDQKAFPVGRDVVDAAGWPPGTRVNREQRHGRAGVKARSGLDRHGHDLVVERKVEELLPVAAPAGDRATGGGDLPRASRPRE